MSIKSPGSSAGRVFLGLGDMKSGLLHDTVPVVLGGGLALGATLGIRQFVAPVENGAPNPVYKYAPLIGGGAGALVGGGIAFFLAGGKRPGWGAAIAAAISSMLSAGGLMAMDMLLTDQTPAQREQHFIALSPGPATPAQPQQGVYLRPSNGQAGLGEVVARDQAGRTRLGNVNYAAYGANYR